LKVFTATVPESKGGSVIASLSVALQPLTSATNTEIDPAHTANMESPVALNVGTDKGG
jgi:hypothetical protein